MNTLSNLARVARRRRRSGAMALIIALSFVVLMTIVVVVFLSHARMSMMILNARTASTQVDAMTRSVIEFTKGDLRQEIVAGSTNNPAVYSASSGAGTVSIYEPATNFTVVPSRTGFTPGTPGSDPLDNIVKISKYQTNFFGPSGYYNASYPSPSWASPVSTGTPSLSGRHIDSTNGWTASGWNKPKLVDTVKYGAAALQSIPLPDWIYVTTTGRQVLTKPVANVVGRYAFVIYDEGGLLDINVAGYPSSISSPDARDPARKGPLGLADLTQIPGGSGSSSSQMTGTMRDSLIAWRNQATSASGAFSSITAIPSAASPDYLKYIFNGSLNRGATSIYPGDQKFLSRQEMLAFSQANPSILPEQSLAYLTTFTRGLNAPTWTPVTPSGSSFDYASMAQNTANTANWTYNIDSANYRWPTTVANVTRPKLDADVDLAATSVPTETVTFYKGDPVLQHRFPLSKLALLSNPNAKTQSPATVGSIAWAVDYYFGLQWVATDASLGEPHWVYAHANAGTLSGSTAARAIASIPDVAAKKREPDFFEMLRQGILRGSAQDIMILEMGACLIDQYDTDDVPTAITFPASGGYSFREVFGKENLPYFYQMLAWPYRPKSDATRTTFEGYLVPMFWSPHRNASTVASVTNFQAILTPTAGNTPIVTISGSGANTGLGFANSYATSGLATAGTLTFTTSSTTTYQTPTLLTGGTCVPTMGAGMADVPASSRAAFYLGSVTAPDKLLAMALGGSGTGMATLNKATVSGGMTLVVKCQDSSGTWHTYENVPLSVGTAGSWPWATTDNAGANGVDASPSFGGGQGINYYGALSSGALDPRVCGPSGGGGSGIARTGLYVTSIGTLPAGSTLQPVAPQSISNGVLAKSTLPASDFGYFPLSSPTIRTTAPIATPNISWLGMWNKNDQAGPYTYYQDFCYLANAVGGDNIQRPGDGVYGANPMAVPSGGSDYITDRSIILNRPFRSVAEMGYAYRGIEWKTIDFCSTLSGDAGLLDMFSVGEANKITQNSLGNTVNTPLMGGVLSINTRHPEVLESLLSGSLKNDLDTSAGSVISATQAGAIADVIVAETSSSTAGHGPLINRSELVTRIMGLSAVTSQLSGTVSKPEREAVTRALVEPADTRTWNLLIDLDVQVGHYPPTAIATGTQAALSRFDVQGDRRYWLHLAIDRYTGNVIDEQLEVVNDN